MKELANVLTLGLVPGLKKKDGEPEKDFKVGTSMLLPQLLYVTLLNFFFLTFICIILRNVVWTLPTCSHLGWCLLYRESPTQIMGKET